MEQEKYYIASQYEAQPVVFGKPDRKTYDRPTLIIYGDISEITQESDDGGPGDQFAPAPPNSGGAV